MKAMPSSRAHRGGRMASARRRRVLLATVFTFGIGAICAGQVSGHDRRSTIKPESQRIAQLSSSLALGEAEWLVEGAQEAYVRQASHQSPSAYLRRWRSQLAYAHLSARAAIALSRSRFGRYLGAVEAGTPRIPGARILKYTGEQAAEVVLHGHTRGLLATARPIAAPAGKGRFAPINLSITKVGGVFRPLRPAVAVQIPKRLGSGVKLASIGVSLTPVDAHGKPLSGGAAGQLDGASVVYPNAIVDGDAIVKPTAQGVSTDMVLRSTESSRRLYFRVGAPRGATLITVPDGAIEIQRHQVTLATIDPPRAVDAEGDPVPVSMAVRHSTVEVTVADLAGYDLPVLIDPTLTDHQLATETLNGTTPPEHRYAEWSYIAEGSAFEGTNNGNNTWTFAIGTHTATEKGRLVYTTRGESQIIKAGVEGTWNLEGAHVQNLLVLRSPAGFAGGHGTGEYKIEAESILPVRTKNDEIPFEAGGEVCEASLHCDGTKIPQNAPPGRDNNTVEFIQQSTQAFTTSAPLTTTLSSAYVVIQQEAEPALAFNTSSPTITNSANKESVTNVLYGSGSWLGPHNGVFEVDASDPGLGIKLYSVLGGGVADYRDFYDGYPAGCWGLECVNPANRKTACFGVQCPEFVHQGYTYDSQMPDGIDETTAFVENMFGKDQVIWNQKIKVDATPPPRKDIKVEGLENGDELPLGQSTIAISATDGENGIPSSGIKSITATIDGTSVPGTPASCHEGPCSATTELTLNSRNYTAGEHTLDVIATDNANNVTGEEFQFRVHGAMPVSVGPGTIDPTTGEFTMTATDVSFGTIDVSRTYKSLHLTAGEEGPLGDAWELNAGAGEGLHLQPDGDAVLAASGGASTTFLPAGHDVYTSPPADGNLTLVAEEPHPGQGVTNFTLTDTTAGTSTKFERPANALTTPPVAAAQFGEGTGELSGPTDDAVDPSGNVWVTSPGTNQIEKYSTGGLLEASYGSYGQEAGEFDSPWGIASDHSGNIYVTDRYGNRVEELSPSGVPIRVFGWGVSDGREQFETCIKECRDGIAGDGAGQFNEPTGVTVDASGNIWVAEAGNNRIQEFSSEAKPSASLGSGQLSEPLGITVAAGNVYVADAKHNRVEEFTTAGTVVQAIGREGTEAGQWSHPTDVAFDVSTGDLYVTDSGNDRIQQLTLAGSFVNAFKTTSGAAPSGIATSPQGSVFVAVPSGSRVEEWTRPSWVPTEAGGALSGVSTTYAYQTVVTKRGRAITEPSEVLAPVPAGVDCKPSLQKGCRALTFEYAEKTTAEGDEEEGNAESEWGEYEGDLSRVDANIWSPKANAMVKIPVAEYAYDPDGRLRAEWDPRVAQARDCTATEHACANLKTVYGYGEEGESEAEEPLTAITAPGQETVALTYGVLSGEFADEARLLKVTQGSSATPLWSGHPVELGKPTISGSLVVGNVLTAKAIATNNPVAHAYHWLLCNNKGKSCKRVPGAINATYTPQASEAGDYLAVIVSATNGSGSTIRKSATYGPLAASGTKTPGEPQRSEPGTTIEYGIPVSGTGLPNLGTEATAAWGEKDDTPVEGVAVFAPGQLESWPAKEYVDASIEYWDKQGRLVNAQVPGGGIATTEYNAYNEVVRTLSADNRQTALDAKSSQLASLLSTERRYNGETTAEREHEEQEVKEGRKAASAPGSELLEIRGPQHKVKLAETGAVVQAREHTVYSYGEGAPTPEDAYLLTKTREGAEYEGKEADIDTTVTEYGGQGGLGWTLRKPTSVTTDPNGLDLTSRTVYDKATGDVVETTTPAGASKHPVPAYALVFGQQGAGEGEFGTPVAIAVSPVNGDVYVADSAKAEVLQFGPTGAFLGKLGESEGRPGHLTKPEAIAVDSSGNIWVGDGGSKRIEKFNKKGKFVRALEGTAGAQLGGAIRGIAIVGKDIWVADSSNRRLEEFTPAGKHEQTIGPITTGEAEFGEPAGLTAHSGNLYVTDPTHHRIQVFAVTTKTSRYQFAIGNSKAGPGQLEDPTGIAADPETGDLYVTDSQRNMIDEFASTGAFVARLGSSGNENGQFESPDAAATSASGNLYAVDGGNHRISVWQSPLNGPHTVVDTYYSAERNPAHPQCGEHPEWANLICEATPLGQPLGEALPRLPVARTTYTMWDQASTITETFGARVRTKAQTYDPAGRAESSTVYEEEKGTRTSHDAQLPEVKIEYNAVSGLAETQHAGTETITETHDPLGRPREYIDAHGVTTTYTYNAIGQLEAVNYGTIAGISPVQTYRYSPIGQREAVEDSLVGTFTAHYDTEGNLVSQTYPNGMIAKYERNSVGEDVGLEYAKGASCASNCVLYEEHDIPRITGGTATQESTLTKNESTYDAAGRLLTMQEAPRESNCTTTRTYSYDEEGDRTNLTTTAAGSGEQCATGSGTEEPEVYDTAGRLYDSGVTYEAFGGITALPARYAGGHPVTSSYYVDGQIATQEQDGKKLAYNYDPTGRTSTIVTNEAYHRNVDYSEAGEAVTWITESANIYERNVPGIDGTLSAIERSGQESELQLHDLRGDVIATAGVHEGTPTLKNLYNSTEFGVPQPGTTAPTYAYLGATGLRTELPSSGIVTTGAESYVPEVGRILQTALVVSPGSFPDGTGGAGIVPTPTLGAAEEELKQIAAEHEAELEAVKQREAEERAAQEAYERESPCEKTPSSCPRGPGQGNCENNCVTEIEEEQGATEEGTGGNGAAHIADGEPVVCEKKVNNPHESTHVPGTVNIVVSLVCSAVVYNVRLRISLYFNGKEVATTSYRTFGDTAGASTNLAVPCRTGVYQGWGYADWENPVGDDPHKAKLEGWGFKVKVTCK